MTWLIVLAVGALVGVLMGSLGGGGAIIAIPALIYLLGQEPQQAATTSLVIVALTSLVGITQHGRAGRVAWGEGLAFAVLGVVGSVLGSLASAAVPESVLMVTFGLLLLVVAVIMARRARAGGRRGGGEAAEVEPTPVLSLRPFHVETSRVLPVVLAASAVGFLTGFFGVGGGFAVVPALTLVLGLGMRRAVGTSLLVITVSAVIALVTRAASGGIELDWGVTVGFTVVAMLASLAGGRIAQRVPAHKLQGAFAALLVVVALITLGEQLVA